MYNACRSCAIRSRALCSALPDATLEQINRLSRRRRVPAGRALFTDDEVGSVVANVHKGVAKVSVSLPDGRTQVVGLHFPSDFIGRPFTDSPAPLIEAATDLEICLFDRSRFEALLRAHEGLERLFVQRMTAELDRARDWMLLLGHKSAREKVASFILLCCDRMGGESCLRGGSEGSRAFDLPLSRTEIAQFLGLTIETVSRMLRQLAADRIIEVERGRGVRVFARNSLAEAAMSDGS